jgi:hypothetical protein
LKSIVIHIKFPRRSIGRYLDPQASIHNHQLGQYHQSGYETKAELKELKRMVAELVAKAVQDEQNLKIQATNLKQQQDNYHTQLYLYVTSPS